MMCSIEAKASSGGNHQSRYHSIQAISAQTSSVTKTPSTATTGAEMGVRLGQRVRHGKFGDGVILNCEGQGAHARVEVNFETAGTKWLVLNYANLDLM